VEKGQLEIVAITKCLDFDKQFTNSKETNMKRFYFSLILVCSAAVTLPAYAATGNMPGMDNMGTVSGQATKAQTFMGQGKINSINPDANTVNVAMGPVKALGWPSMSMNFLLQNTAMLNGHKTGEVVNFNFAKDTAGGYVITRITPVRQ
jgi:Cu/Ag efflux protein CusF